MKHLGLVLCIWTMLAWSGCSANLFKQLVEEMQACVLDEQIPPVAHSVENVKVILATIQDTL